MKTTELRQLIQESIQEYIREVETSGNIAAQEAKIRACEEAIAIREKKINLEGLDETMHEMIDKSKLNELKKEVKELQKYKTKAENLLEKMKNRAEGKTTKKMKDESVEEEAVIDEVNIDETFPESGAQLEELDEAKKKQMTSAQKEKKEDIVKGMKKSKSFGKSKEEKGKMYATATKLAMKESENEEVINESFLHMQKLAGLITEAEYQKKKEILTENEEAKKAYKDSFQWVKMANEWMNAITGKGPNGKDTGGSTLYKSDKKLQDLINEFYNAQTKLTRHLYEMSIATKSATPPVFTSPPPSPTKK